MSGSTWLIDKSAMVRLGTSPDAEQWAKRIQRGLVHICTVTLLEVGCSARTAHDLSRGRRTPPLSAMPLEYSTPAVEDRALDVQRQLAERGQHRAPSIPDLLIAATAEINNRVVLHLDKDFDLIAAITSQPLERLVA
ncbi:PIN domain nuclease [Rhodococcus sp. ZPP]|uniref:PIN domain nuclease n=1 Tax=Rhodococcus sp. ZPP TaxID=2749906 RepID=UPI001AD86E36|nr:PIN domain nuclease [Rhodococcus sp. ZPP]QTJ67153.1 PIN domain nuclease [Rhodococcus sp. ZPP]